MSTVETFAFGPSASAWRAVAPLVATGLCALWMALVCTLAVCVARSERTQASGRPKSSPRQLV